MLSSVPSEAHPEGLVLQGMVLGVGHWVSVSGPDSLQAKPRLPLCRAGAHPAPDVKGSKGVACTRPGGRASCAPAPLRTCIP